MQGDYRPDYFEYDDEDEYGEINEKVILDHNHVQRDVVKTIGRKKVGAQMIQNFEFDEDALIEAYLESNKQ